MVNETMRERKAMKSFFIVVGAMGLISLVGLGVYLSIGIPANSKVVVKEINVR